jgi:hypothetical protein
MKKDHPKPVGGASSDEVPTTPPPVGKPPRK